MTPFILLALLSTLVLPSQGTPAAGGFASTVKDPSPTCRSAISSLPDTLVSCYDQTPLYFSVPNTVCSDQCLEPTIEGAKAIATSCTSTSDNLPNHGTYVAWANPAAAKAACARTSTNRHCLELFASAMVTADELALLQKEPTEKQLTLVGCKEACAKAYYRAVQGDAAKSPTLYYYGGAVIKNLLGVWKQYCQWKDNDDNE